ncbi:hypothetical protein BJ742DRAFT_848930 [Cladochytrium replicatum]|nr:hypothetical protein BJ742DRAFT_848930 [Cladochytrium replicatum]
MGTVASVETSRMEAVVTGIQAVYSIARSFGIQIQPPKPHDDHVMSGTLIRTQSSASAYVSLMAVRRLATGVLLTYARQEKWEEIATLLLILGFVVAGTDGHVLWD